MRLTLFKIYVLFVESLHNRVQLSYQCGFCHEIFNNVENYNVHKESHEPNGSFKIVESHFNKSCLRYRRVFGENVVSIHAAFQLVLEELLEIIKSHILRHTSVLKRLWKNVNILFRFFCIKTNIMS